MDRGRRAVRHRSNLGAPGAQQGQETPHRAPRANSAKSAYTSLHTGSIPFRGHAIIWKTWAPLRVKSSYGSHSGGVTGLMFAGQGMDSRREKSVTSATRRRRQLITFCAAAPSHESFGSAFAKL